MVALIDQYQCRNGLSNQEGRLALACGKRFAYPLGIGWICEVEVFELTLNNSISYPIHGSGNIIKQKQLLLCIHEEEQIARLRINSNKPNACIEEN